MEPGNFGGLTGLNGLGTHGLGPSASKRMKLSHLDYLVNPLRTDHPFGK